MLKPAVTKTDNAESRFLHLYKIVQEREKYLSKEALVVQYSALLRYFMKFLQQKEEYTANVAAILYWTYTKLGDIYYEDALQIRIIVNTFWQQNIITSLWLMRAVRKKKAACF